MISTLQKLVCMVWVFMLFLIKSGDAYSQSDIWVGTWSTANYAAGANNTPPSPFLANNTLRQIVRVSIGGDSLRVKFSNKTCATPVTMKSVNIAVSKGGSSVDASTISPLQFKGNSSVKMNAYSAVTSDPVAFALRPGMRVAITIHYGQASSNADITSHVASRTDSYILAGDHSTSADFGGSVITAQWFHINNIDVLAPDSAGCVAVLGNSITDGYGLSGGKQNRWTDIFSEQLLDDPRTKNVGVLNQGIGGTNLTTSGLSRYKDDLLSQSGLRWIIIFYGVNDIAGGRTASSIIDAYKKIIADAYAINVKVYGATITPFKGHSHYTVAREAIRNEVNEWIRTPGNFDACIDFDKAIRDPNDHEKILAKYSNDWLHPIVSGYELLGKSVDIDLFTMIENTRTLFARAGADQTVVDYGNTGNGLVILNGSDSFLFGGNIASYIWSKDGSQIATGESPTVSLPLGTHLITLTISDYAGNTDSDEVIIYVVKDSGVWLEAECGTVGSLWNIETDNNASNGKYLTIKPGNNSLNNASGNASGLITYTFDISEGGSYNLFLRVICPDPNADSFWLKMNNGAFASWNNIGPSNTWQWFAYPNAYSLSAGTHTLIIGYREDGAKLDKIYLTKSGDTPSGVGESANNCTTSTGFRMNRGNDKFSFRPNPAKNMLFVTISDTEITNMNLYILNMSGIVIKKTSNLMNENSINLSGIKPGQYLIVLENNNTYACEKLIIK